MLLGDLMGQCFWW